MRLKRLSVVKIQGPEERGSSQGIHKGLHYLVISFPLSLGGLFQAYSFSTPHIRQDPEPESSLSDLNLSTPTQCWQQGSK